MWRLRYFLSSFWLLFGVIWAAVGTPFVVTGITVGVSEWRLREQATPIEVRVVEQFENQEGTGDSEYFWWFPAFAFAGFGAIFAGVGWTLVLRRLPDVLARISLIQRGWIGSGIVREVRQDRRTRINGRHPFYLVFTFESPDGVEREGNSIYLPRALENRFSAGDRVPVVYHPRNPERFDADVLGVRSDSRENPLTSPGAFR